MQAVVIIPRLMIHLLIIMIIGPSGVRALPMAAGINVGGHYKWHFFLFLSSFFRAHC